MAPMEALQLTALVGEPLARALHWLVWRDWMALGVQLTVIEVSGVTVTVALPVMVVVSTDVAVMVTLVLPVTAWAAKTPFWSMRPALEPQETAVLKLVPVPLTVAVHELVWPDCSEVGLQATVTAVTVVLLEPPPQAAIPKSAMTASIRPKARKTSPRSSVAAFLTVNEYGSTK